MSLLADLQIVDDVAIMITGEERYFEGLKVIRDHAIESIRFFRALLGFYPHQHLVILPGADRPMGGFPAGQGVVKIHGVNVMDQKPDGWWDWITAHEVGHMYWGFHVLDADRTKRDQLGWLNIGLGLYTDRLYVSARQIDCQFHENQKKAFLEARDEGKVTRFGLSKEELGSLDFDYNTIVRHGRAFSVIEEVAQHVGTERFQTILRELATSFANRELGYVDFRAFIEQQTESILPSFVPEFDG